MTSAINQAKQRRRNKFVRTGITYDVDTFIWGCKNLPDRINIIGEGDSWFAYPNKNIIGSKRTNMLDYVCKSIWKTKKANLLRIASNGDEAIEMMAGSQKHELAEILKKGGSSIDLILFSGGGNDVVGKWDMERLLNDFQTGFSARQCLNEKRVKRKLQQVKLAYQELVELRDEYAPKAQIVGHTYDLVLPNGKSAKFLAGLVAIGPWIQPYLKQKNIPERLHFPIIKLLLGDLSQILLALAASNSYKDKLFVVNTQGTLRPGHKSDWQDEMHPTSSGFKRITQKYYQEMRRLQPKLPGFKA